MSDSVKPGPPTEPEAQIEVDEEDNAKDRKRARQGSVAALPPGTDEAGMGVDSDQDAKGAPQSPKPQSSSARGRKRESGGGDEEREEGREHWQDADNGAASSSGPWRQGEDAAMDALDKGARMDHMKVIRMKLGCSNDVSEVYSPPRIVTVAEAAGLRGGFSLDLTAPSPDGTVWDFSRHDCRRRALELVQSQRPYLLIGSPPCTAFSNLQNLNRCRPGGNEKVDAAQRKAAVHLSFCSRLYREQMAHGRYFLHEHPKSATSWKLGCMTELSNDPMLLTAEIDQCAYGLRSKDKEGEGPAKKPTRFLTNSVAMQQALSKKCQGCVRHVQLVEGRASAAQEYPRELCRAVTRGIIEQARLDTKTEEHPEGMYSLVCKDIEDGLYDINHIRHDEEDWKAYWDDLSGEKLDTKLTKEARAEEIEGIHKSKVYQKVPISMCLSETGKRPIGTRWVDTNKGDRSKPKIRSRLVAQEINRFKQPELFAATPPVEYIRYLVSCCASSQWTHNPTRIMVQDVKKAYFYAPATRRVFVALPDEDRLEGEEDQCALLLQSLYGTRDAAFNWTSAYTNALESIGFVKGASSPCSFRHEKKCINVVVHGDDFMSEGEAHNLKWFDVELSKHFELKTEVLGPDAAKGEVQELRFLNRVITWTGTGIVWEADPRHAELLIEQLNLKGAKEVCSPGIKDEVRPRSGKKGKASEKEDVEEEVGSLTSEEEISSLMSADGWINTGKRTFVKKQEGVTAMVMPPVGRIKRRVTRDADSGTLIEDLWTEGRMSDRRLTRELRMPANLEFRVELMAIDEQGGSEFDETPMESKDASLFRAAVARTNFLAQDRCDLQFASKECSRRMSCRGSEIGQPSRGLDGT